MTMKVSKRDLTLLLIVCGAIIAFCTFQFYYRGAMDKKKKYEEENAGYEKRLDALRSIEDQKLLQTMAQNTQTLESKAEKFRVKYQLEDLIMYLNEWEKLPYEEIYAFKTYAIGETEVLNTESGIIDWDNTNQVQKSISYEFGTAAIQTSFETNSYKALKDIINKIYLDATPKSISNISATMDGATGKIQGNMKIAFYNVGAYGENNMPMKVDPALEINNVPTGISNIFGPTFTPTPSPTPTPRPGVTPEEE